MPRVRWRRDNWTTTTSSPAAAIPAKLRIYGVPSGREIKRIPVFNIDPMVGWGITNESKKIIGTKPDGSLKYMRRRHPPRARLVQGRHLRRQVRLDQRQDQQPHGAHPPATTWNATRSPNCPTCRASTASSRTSATRWTRTSTTPPACSAAPSSTSRCPTTAATWTTAKKYACLFTCVDAETMEVRWQVLIDGNCDLVRHLLRRQAGGDQPVQHREAARCSPT